MAGGPIAVVQDDDYIEIDIPGRRLDIVGARGRCETAEAMEPVIRERLDKWVRPPQKFGGVLGLYTSLAVSGMDGGYMDTGRCPIDDTAVTKGSRKTKEKKGIERTMSAQ
jgi:dihydroxy-acid dehydratase